MRMLLNIRSVGFYLQTNQQQQQLQMYASPYNININCKQCKHQASKHASNQAIKQQTTQSKQHSNSINILACMLSSFLLLSCLLLLSGSYARLLCGLVVFSIVVSMFVVPLSIPRDRGGGVVV